MDLEQYFYDQTRFHPTVNFCEDDEEREGEEDGRERGGEGEGEGGGGIDFDMVEKFEILQTLALLNKTENRLYDLNLRPDPQPTITSEEDMIRRYYSEGYEANYEAATNDEILRWQRVFPYLRVMGGRGQDNLTITESSEYGPCIEDESSSSSYFEVPHSGVDLSSLVVVGKQITFSQYTPNQQQGSSSSSSPQHGEEGEEIEEIFAQDGVVEELLAADMNEEGGMEIAPAADVEGGSGGVSTDWLSVWQDVVQHLRPLVKKVLSRARENNIPKDLEKLEELAGKNQQSNMEEEDW
eukprot:gene3889-4249_t